MHVLATDPVTISQDYNYMGEFINMLITLAVVLSLIFLTIWMLKKVMRSRVKALNRSNGIKILERRPLNPKASLYLVDILGKGVVISESPSGIHVVTEFPEHVNIQELLSQVEEQQEPKPSFTEIFSKLKRVYAR
ncbi:MAG: flagellar biosynthetic protein FliO [Chlamydiia bacterium]|nr:flagellar biosynthetic protein FliO [Chlamydiia bacterium]